MKRPLITALTVAAILAVPGIALLGRPDPTQPDSGQAIAADRAGGSGSIVATYGVGGVLKADGNLYQWRPERRQWVSLDESFRLDNEKRNVLPLPVAASEVARMEGFGFIVTKSGQCWLYNLDSNRWENIGRP
jgi:hypothetical protein